MRRPASRLDKDPVIQKGLGALARAATSGMALVVALAGPTRPLFATGPMEPTPATPRGAAPLTLEAIFPAGTILLFGASNLNKSLETLKQTALYEIWMEPQLQKFLEKPMQMVAALPAMLNAELAKVPGAKGLDADALKNVFGGDFAVACTGLKMPAGAISDQNPPDVGLVLVAQLGNEATFDSVLNAFESAVKNETPGFTREKLSVGGVSVDSFGAKEEPIRLYVGKTAGYAVLSISKDALGFALGALGGKAPGPSLAGDANYAQLAKDVRGQSEIGFCYMNTEALITALNPILPPQAKAVMDACGLGQLKGFAFSESFEGKGFLTTGRVLCPGPRKGFMKLLDAAPLDLGVLDTIPKDVTSFSVGQLDLGTVWTSIWDCVHAVVPEKEAELKGMLGQFEAQAGVKIKEDLIDSLGSRLVFFQRAQQVGQMIPDMAFTFAVKKSDKLQEAISKLTKLAGTPIKEVSIGDTTYHYADLSAVLPILLIQPSYAFVGDDLVVSLTLPSLKSIVNGRKDKSFVSVKEHEEFKTLLPRIPKSVTSISYTDVKRSFGNGYDQVKNVLPLLAMQLGSEIPVDIALLPTSDVFTRHLFGSYSYSVPSPDGEKNVSVGPMSTMILIPVVAIGAGAAAAVVGMRQSMEQAHRRTAESSSESGEDEEESDEGSEDENPPKEPKFSFAPSPDGSWSPIAAAA